MCAVLLPPGGNPIAVKYTCISYHISYRFSQRGYCWDVRPCCPGLHSRGRGLPGCAPSPQTEFKKSFVDTIIWNFYVIYPSAEICYWNRPKNSTTEFWKRWNKNGMYQMKLNKPRILDLVTEISRVSHGICHYICMYINAVAKNTLLLQIK
jgi:hypothetical protein